MILMKTSIGFLTCVLTLWPMISGAQENVPAADAQKYAQILAKAIEGVTDLPLACELDLEQPAAVRAGEAGALVIPDKRLTAAKLAAAGKVAVPVGHLWLRNVAVERKGSALPNSEQRTVKVTSGENTAEAQVFVLGARRGAGDVLELVVYGRGTEPVTSLPIAKKGEAATTPVQIQGRKTGEHTGAATLIFFGQQQVEIPLIKPGE